MPVGSIDRFAIDVGCRAWGSGHHKHRLRGPRSLPPRATQRFSTPAPPTALLRALRRLSGRGAALPPTARDVGVYGLVLPAKLPLVVDRELRLAPGRGAHAAPVVSLVGPRQRLDLGASEPFVFHCHHFLPRGWVACPTPRLAMRTIPLAGSFQ